MTSSQKLLWIFIVVLVVGGVTLKFFCFKDFQIFDVKESDQIVLERKIREFPQYQFSLGTSACKNDKYKYEIKYPSLWNIWAPGGPEMREASCDENLASILISPDRNEESSFYINAFDRDRSQGIVYINLKDYLGKNKQIHIEKELEIAGERAIKATNGYFYVVHGGSWFEIRIKGSEVTEQYFFKNFKFLN